MSNQLKVHPFRVFVSTWNVGGKPPHSGLDLDEFLKVHDQSDIYILGFQEIVPLNAGNVLVVEDYEPAAKWLALINHTLNKRPMLDISSSSMTSSDQISSTISLASGKETLILCNSRSIGGLPFFQKPSLKTFSNSFRTETGRRLKACNCPSEFERKYQKESCFGRQQVYGSKDNCYMEDDDCSSRFMMTEISTPSHINQLKYSLISCKQMVGIFLTVWIRKELVQHVSHLRTSCIGRGIMGYLGNKGCISVSMSLHQTSFCFICSHLASGQKEGDELRRNSDVTEILKATQFSKSCKASCSRIPERILEHDRVIWLGDLNYRIALSYFEVRKLLEENDWDSLLYNDQLKIEREAGRVFQGWKEGKIYFAPTYKYSNDSDTFAGEAMKSQKKRRTPAWCDRILWHGNGIKQLSYIRGDLRFSDHRPVCAVFVVDVLVLEGR